MYSNNDSWEEWSVSLKYSKFDMHVGHKIVFIEMDIYLLKLE